MNDNPTMQEQIDALPPETPDRVIATGNSVRSNAEQRNEAKRKQGFNRVIK